MIIQKMQESVREVPVKKPALAFWNRLKDRMEGAKGYAVMTRSYSLGDGAGMALVAKTNCSDLQFNAGDGAVAGVLSLMWASFNWFLEAAHGHNGRPRISRKTADAVFGIAAGIAAIFNPLTLLATLAYRASYCIYSKKEGKSDIFGAFSFIPRGIAAGAAYLTARLMYGTELQLRDFAFAAVIGMMTSARNLVGDIRDMAHDKKTFCVRYGKGAADAVVVGLKGTAAAGIATLTGSLLAPLPLIIESVLQLACKNNFKLHRWGVFGTTLTLAGIAIANVESMMKGVGMQFGIAIGGTVALSALLNIWTYEKVPRECDKD